MIKELCPEESTRWYCCKVTFIVIFAVAMETLNCLLLYHQQDFIEYYDPSEGTIAFMKIAEDVHWKVILAITYFCFPLIQSYSVTVVVLYSIVFSNLFKIWYSPFFFWISFEGFPSYFRSDYAFISTSLYLSVYRLVRDTDYFRDRPCAKGWLFFFLCFFLGGMNLLNFYCRLNYFVQTIHDMSLGYVIYFVVFHIIELHLYDSRRFFDPHACKWRNRCFKIFNFWVFVAFLLAIFSSYFEIKTSPKMTVFNHMAFNKSLCYFGIIGAYYGISWCIIGLINKYGDKHDEINNWFEGDLRLKTKKGSILFFAIGLHCLVFLIPKEHETLCSIFKIAIPFFTVFFVMYGLGIYVIVVTNLGNPEIYESQQEYQIIKKKKKYIQNNNENSSHEMNENLA